nr:MAG TPA: hypothetical protein [Caudoviricetes sp.]
MGGGFRCGDSGGWTFRQVFAFGTVVIPCAHLRGARRLW